VANTCIVEVLFIQQKKVLNEQFCMLIQHINAHFTLLILIYNVWCHIHESVDGFIILLQASITWMKLSFYCLTQKDYRLSVTESMISLRRQQQQQQQHKQHRRRMSSLSLSFCTFNRSNSQFVSTTTTTATTRATSGANDSSKSIDKLGRVSASSVQQQQQQQIADETSVQEPTATPQEASRLY
jgi:hypothetical protein